MTRASSLRPSLEHPTPTDVGHRLGHSRGVECFSTVEDSTVVLGPPRSGKGLHLVIPAILDAPGAVITTSTRPDNLTATLRARQARGPVAVFDPQGLAPGIPSAARWSPIRGCEDPHVAMVRAKALTAGAARGTTDANFWQASAEQAVRALLHAAALGGRSSTDLYRWSLSAVHAREAVTILSTEPAAAAAWHQGLDSLLEADPRQRDSVWAMVSIAFAALADPRVLDAVSPGEGEQFDPAKFLTGNGTIYLLGTSTGAAATAGLVGAFLEDVLEVARRMAAASPGSRLDPPLSMVLDEAANYPLPSLASLMSDGGGSGIATTVVLQSLAQARAVWGEHAASAIWDAAIVKIVLGGGSNARDLEDLSKLIGTREREVISRSTGGDGRWSTSSSTSEVPILEPARLRTLPFGTSILLLRSARPIELTMQPWSERPDATTLHCNRAALEEAIRRASALQP
ncbi:type IV secretory system conjugative DNA transfer family protein [Terrabacter terrigena]|uniref:Type IV secretory system conjugative DNA transfer family protein n=1 Tax=Terrabacter terrigena TaxID=574718 RepID=A0ABW3N2E5_9MICO